MPPVAGADFLAALEANCFLGALAPVDFLAVCLVLAIDGKDNVAKRKGWFEGWLFCFIFNEFEIKFCDF